MSVFTSTPNATSGAPGLVKLAGALGGSATLPIAAMGVSALADGATPALDASLGNIFTLSAAGNRTIAIPSNPTVGQKIIIRHTASGADRTLSLNRKPGGFRFNENVTALTATKQNATDFITAVYNSADDYWDVIDYRKGAGYTVTPLCGMLRDLTAGAGSETKYSSLIGGGSTAGATAEVGTQIFPCAGTISNFRVELSTEPTSGDSWTITIMAGATAGTVAAKSTVTITTGTTAIDVTDYAIAAENRVYVKIESTTAAGSPSTDIRWVAEFRAGTYGVLMGNIGSVTSNAAARYFAPHGRGAVNTTEPAAAVVVPTAGTLSRLTTVSVGGTHNNTYTITVYLNGSPTSLTAECPSSDVVASDTVNTVAVVAGDTISIESGIGNAPDAASMLQYSMLFLPTTPGETLLMVNATGVNTASQEYASPVGELSALAAETDVACILPVGVLKKFYVTLVTAPNTGKSWTDDVYVEGSASALTCSIADAATTANDVVHEVTISDGDLVSFSTTPSGTPDTSASHYLSCVYVGPGN